MTPHLNFIPDRVHIEGNLSKNVIAHEDREEEGKEEMEDRRRKGGGDWGRRRR